jgi:enoyl-CoA hydratase/carnithine racemase
MPYETLTLEREGKVATLTLSRPDRMNAFDTVMRAELPRAWAEIEADPEVWAVIVTGAGDRAFSAGMDLREPPPAVRPDGSLPRVHLTAQDCGVMKPVIAAVNGVCAGGGLCFVSDADIVIAADSAYFTDARTSAGQVSIHGTLRMARKIPLEALFRLTMLGKAERVDAARALEIGLVGEVVPPAALLARAREIALAIVKSSPAALFHTKHAIWDSLDHGLNTALGRGWGVVTRFAREHGDALEGARAFVEKRPPVWTYSPPPRLER